VYSLDVLKEIIESHDLYKFKFHFCCHEATLNWRQLNTSIIAKMKDIVTGIKFDSYKPIQILGTELLNLDYADLDKFTIPEKPLLSISSLIYSDSDHVCHIPMMNLHTDSTICVNDLRHILNILINSDFWLIKTDRFYHVYSDLLMNKRDWLLWNLKFLMADCLVSPRYIGHSLERGFNLLRLNSTTEIKTLRPYLILQSKTGVSNEK